VNVAGGVRTNCVGTGFVPWPTRVARIPPRNSREGQSRLAFQAWHAPCYRPASAMGQKRILVVDDEEVLRGLLADILTCDGHQVDTACDGLEALDWLDQHHYDAVFTDLLMPGLDGPRLYEAVQKRQGEDPPRVIFMTGNAALSADFLRDTREPVLEKPFSLDAARGVVKALFRER